MNRTPEEWANEVIGAVTGHNGDRRPVAFTLTTAEVKHLRRCLTHTENLSPSQNGLGPALLRKFRTFGRRERAVNTQRRRAIMKGPCEDCGSTTDLTLAHIVPHSAFGSNNQDNLRVLCRPCHDVEEDLRIISVYEERLARAKQRVDRTKQLLATTPLRTDGWPPIAGGVRTGAATASTAGRTIRPSPASRVGGVIDSFGGTSSWRRIRGL